MLPVIVSGTECRDRLAAIGGSPGHGGSANMPALKKQRARADGIPKPPDDAAIGRDHIEQRQADDCRAARCEHLAGRLGLKRIRLNPLVK